MLYRLRSVNWQRTPRFISPVYDDTHFYKMVAQLASAHDSVTVPVGQFDASRIDFDITITARNPANQPMQFTLWLANHPARTPVEVDTDVRTGTVHRELVRIE